MGQEPPDPLEAVGAPTLGAPVQGQEPAPAPLPRRRPLNPDSGTEPTATGHQPLPRRRPLTPDSGTEPTATGHQPLPRRRPLTPDSGTEPTATGHQPLPWTFQRTRTTPEAGSVDPTPAAPHPSSSSPPVEPESSSATAPASTGKLDGLFEVQKRRRFRPRTVLASVAAVLVLLLVAAVVGAQLVSRRVLNDVQRIPDVFTPLESADRPQKPTGTEKTLNVLLVGVDSGAGEDSERSDAVMLVHVAASRRSAALVSLPRDSRVAVPDRGVATLSSAYAAGGPSLLVRTVEQLTTLRIDHFAMVDFAGFRDITNAVGGVDVRVAPAGAALPAGVNHLDGDAALRYVRQPARTPGDQLARVRRQQEIMKALMAKVSDVGLTSNPVKTLTLLDSIAAAMSVDDSLSDGEMRSLGLSLRHLRPDQVVFLTAPVSPGGAGGRDVVRLDTVRARALWDAMAKDNVTGYVRGHPDLKPVPG
jgi:LCP family protein required for cell wall assembly